MFLNSSCLQKSYIYIVLSFTARLGTSITYVNWKKRERKKEKRIMVGGQSSLHILSDNQLRNPHR